MSTMKKTDTKLLLLVGTTWYCKRRVPTKFSHVVRRSYIKTSLRTDSLIIARKRRDALVESQNAEWTALSLEAQATDGDTQIVRRVQKARYGAASSKAESLGFTYKTAEELFEGGSVDEVKKRVEALEKHFDISKEPPPKKEADALLGGIKSPGRKSLDIADCFRMFVDEIEFDAQLKKSESQKRSWENSMRAGVDYFIEAVGNIPMDSITREHAIAYRNWWADRIKNGDEKGKCPKPYTANRRIGAMRTIYDRYYTYIGQEDRPNPFRKLKFQDRRSKKRPPFSNQWMLEVILKPGALDGLNAEARGVFLALIETGARPSEICNLRPENIHLNAPTPFIEIREQSDREVKASASNRDIPLIGVSLAAMKANPDGFPRYVDKETHMSNTLMKFFKENGLLETPDHKIYSVRHSFETRMLEAGIDHDLRCTLMGHKLKRPDYGSGGSIEYRRDQLMKIVHAYSSDLSI